MASQVDNEMPVHSSSIGLDRSKIKPQKSILKTEKSFMVREKTNITFEKYPTDTSFDIKITDNSLVRSSSNLKNNFLNKDLNINNFVGKLPAITKEYTTWVLNTNFRPPSRNDDYETSGLSTDWSNFTEEVFSKVESNLKNVLLKREKSSKRRCETIENRRKLENYRAFCGEVLEKYDDEIRLDELMKTNKKYNANKPPRLCCGPNNFKLRLADEMANKKCHCFRFIETRQKYQHNEIVHMFDKDKKRIYKLPSLKKKNRKGNYGFDWSSDDEL